jgi:heme oxygenase
MLAQAASTEAIAPPSVRPGTLRNALRAATAEAHQTLDATFSTFDLQSRDGYRHFLEASGAALLPLEAALTAAGIAGIVPDWAQRVRSAALTADLAALNGTLRPLAMREDFTEAGMLGAAYVLEGSRLGARMLAKTIAASSDPMVRATTAYLDHGAGLPLWPRFLAILNNAPQGPRETREAIAAAHRAFALFAEGARQS